MNHQEAALRYLQRGYSIIPCIPRDKRPCIKWGDYQERLPTEAEVKSWWDATPEANLALVCGKVSGIDVVDLDDTDAIKLVADFLPDNFHAPMVKTSKGMHIYLQHRPGLSNKVSALPKVDLRTTGGYVMLPPSVHPSGDIYKWEDGCGPKDVKPPPWPDALYEVFKNAAEKPAATGEFIGPSDMFTEGRRDSDFFHVAHTMLKGGATEEEALEVLRQIGTATGWESESVWRKKVASAMERRANHYGDLAAAVGSYCNECGGWFDLREIYSAILGKGMNDTTACSAIRMQLMRLVEDKQIERDPRRRGRYRKLECGLVDIEWEGAISKPLDIYLPLGADLVTNVYPGNVIVLSGVSNAGKTAFVIDLMAHNQDRFAVTYLNSEMDKEELADRLTRYQDLPGGKWKIRTVKMPDNEAVADNVPAGEGVLAVFDYIDVDALTPYIIKDLIKKIHSKLNGAIAVICLQKKKDSPYGTGGIGTIQLARLAINIDYDKATIIKAKSPKQGLDFHPDNKSKKFTIKGGWQIIPQSQRWETLS